MMKNDQTSYSLRIGNTTFEVCVKQSNSATKPLENVIKEICRREVLNNFSVLDVSNSDHLKENNLAKKSDSK